MVQPKWNNLSSLDEISIYRSKRPNSHLIVDTNVLFLLLVGLFDLDYLPECPLMTENGKFYNNKHFELLQNILNRFLNRIVITPHILSEIGMLGKKIKPKERFGTYFTTLLAQLNKCIEHPIEMKVLLKNAHLITFGFADMSLIEAADERKSVILTDDTNLYIRFNNSIPIIYFSSIASREISFAH